MKTSIHDKLLAAIKGKENSDIAIIGKGASIDKINLSALENFIIINANDSESILTGDIGVFHHGWVLDRFEHTPPKCQVYITDRQMPVSTEVIPASYAPYGEESDLFVERFFDPGIIWLEHAVVISCLRVANELAVALEKRKRVFLLGFDFSLDQGFSSRVENGLHGGDDAYVEHMIRNQEYYFERLIEESERISIEIAHIGSRPYSILSVDAFNAIHELDGAKVAFDRSEIIKSDVLIVAEITTNHFGDRDRLQAMIRLAKKAGADYIKLQKRNVDSFYSPEMLEKPYKSAFGNTFGDYRRGLELTQDDFEWVDDFCRKIGIGWFASILDETSYDFIRQFKPELIKLPSTISEKRTYLEKVGSDWDRGIVISTGMTENEYEEFIFSSFKNAKSIYLLQCTSAYPTPENDAGVGVIRHYRDLSNRDPRIISGYSSHDIGSLCSQLAVAAGAKMIEKHVKLGSVHWAHFDEVAVDLANGDFSSFVVDVRRAERIAGCEAKHVFSSEHHKY